MSTKAFKKGETVYIKLNKGLIEQVIDWGDTANEKWAKQLEKLLEKHGSGFIPVVVSGVSKSFPDEVKVVSAKAVADFGSGILKESVKKEFAFGGIEITPRANGVLVSADMLHRRNHGRLINV